MLGHYRRSISLGLAGLSLGMVLFTGTARGDEDRKVTKKIAPEYPEMARKMNLAGVVRLVLVIAPNGTVKSAKPLGGHPLLIEPSLEAVKKWHYEPAATETTQTVEIRYNGRGDSAEGN